MLDAFETYQLPTYEFELETAFETSNEPNLSFGPELKHVTLD